MKKQHKKGLIEKIIGSVFSFLITHHDVIEQAAEKMFEDNPYQDGYDDGYRDGKHDDGFQRWG